MKIGIVGAGKMGMSIVNGIISKNVIKKEDIYLTCRSNKFEMINEGYNVLNLKELYQTVDMMILAIKPQNFIEVLEEIKDLKGANSIISIAAGIKISFLERYFENKELIRVMPNTPSLIGMGANVICFKNVKNKEIYFDIFNAIGMTKEIDEDMMEAIIPINGSMPAFFFKFLETYINVGVEKGLDYETCHDLAIASVIGSCNLITSTKRPIKDLIKDVCSKGGVTEEGLKAYDEFNFEEMVRNLYDRCEKKSKEIGKE